MIRAMVTPPPKRRGITAIVLAAALVALAMAPARAGDDVYLEPDAYVAEAFGGQAPAPRIVWLTGDLKQRVAAILGRTYPALRLRYWRDGGRTVWILEEIGKVKPITTGFTIQDGAIANATVLVYRESHGWEVKYPFFTDQFRDIRLTENGGLSASVDNISGATLSVNALRKLAGIALVLHDHVIHDAHDAN